jgi:hypothetical protein
VTEHRTESVRGIRAARWGLLLITAIACGGLPPAAAADGTDALRPARPIEGPASLVRHGEQQLERLPWDLVITRAKVNAKRPAAVAATYLTSTDILVVEENARVTCFARRDLTPRWIWSLSGSLHRPPAEGAEQYVFLCRLPGGSYTLHALSRRTGVDTPGFPVQLPYAVSGGVAANAGMAWIASLGSPRENRTLAGVELVTGRPGWGWLTTGLVNADPVLDPSGQILVAAQENGTVLAFPATGQRPEEPSWSASGLSSITATPAVTPDHLIVGSHDGLVRCFEIRSGEVLWMKSVGEAIKSDPWVLGGVVTEERPSGVEGAPPIKVDVYKGIAFVRNVSGLHAFDVQDGTPLFTDPQGGKPLLRHEKWLVTLDRNRMATLRDMSDGFKAKGRLSLGMFDLLPTNESGGGLYGVTADGYVVSATPR